MNNNNNHQESKFSKPNEEHDDGLFITSLEAFLFARRLQQHQKMSNKVDKNLATMLLEIAETVNNFLESATVEDVDESRPNLDNLLPSVESYIFQAHRMYFCSACNKNIKAIGSSLHAHFLSDSHLKHLKSYAKGISVATNDVKENIAVVKEKKRNNSLPALLKEVGVKESLPRKMREFLATKDIMQFTNTLVREGHALKASGQYNRICQMLQKHLAHRYPQVRAYAFGSVVNGLGRPGSDLDIFIDTENCFYKRLSKRKMKDAIYQVQRILSNVPHQQWDNFEPVVHARTPILRAFCVAENIDCDLSFSNGLSTCNTSLISHFIDIQPICKQIISFLKFWAKQLQLGVNSYLITLMVIFYLQQETLLPPVKVLQDATNEIRIDGWNANFAQLSLQQLQMPLATDFKKYLIGFFRFYGFDFDYNNYVICVLTGTRIPKHFFDHGREHQLPPVFKAFADYMSKINIEEADEVDDLFSNYKPLVIQDPFELIHNVSKGVQEPKLCKIISYLRSTHELLMNAKF